MVRMRAEVVFPDDATAIEIEEAKLAAEWKVVRTVKEIMAATDLTNKCGSCKHFCAWRVNGSYGDCKKGRTTRQRSQKACKKYYEVEE